MTSLLERYPVINICQTAVAAATTLPWKILEAVALIPFSWVLGWGPGNFRVTARPASAAATTRAGSTCRGSGGESSHFLDGHITFHGQKSQHRFCDLSCIMALQLLASIHEAPLEETTLNH